MPLLLRLGVHADTCVVNAVEQALEDPIGTILHQEYKGCQHHDQICTKAGKSQLLSPILAAEDLATGDGHGCKEQ